MLFTAGSETQCLNKPTISTFDHILRNLILNPLSAEWLTWRILNSKIGVWKWDNFEKSELSYFASHSCGDIYFCLMLYPMCRGSYLSLYGPFKSLTSMAWGAPKLGTSCDLAFMIKRPLLTTNTFKEWCLFAPCLFVLSMCCAAQRTRKYYSHIS